MFLWLCCTVGASTISGRQACVSGWHNGVLLSGTRSYSLSCAHTGEVGIKCRVTCRLCDRSDRCIHCKRAKHCTTSKQERCNRKWVSLLNAYPHSQAREAYTSLQAQRLAAVHSTVRASCGAPHCKHARKRRAHSTSCNQTSEGQILVLNYN